LIGNLKLTSEAACGNGNWNSPHSAPANLSGCQVNTIHD
jgi:hypothetical protein